MKHLLPALVLIAIPLTVGAQDPDRALHARAILRQHCGACHDVDKTKLGEISVTSRDGMERPARPFLKPGDPNASQIIDLIEAGNMPPGTRPKVSPDDAKVLRDWITASAPDYPKQFDDDYVVGVLTAHHAKQSAADQPLQRYFSLAHLVGNDTFTLESQRAALKKAVRDLSKPDAAVDPVDPAQTVFRVNIRALGWDEKPFTATEYFKKDNGSRGERSVPSTLNLFDMLLLEYPFGQTYAKAVPVVKALGEVRPVAFVRGDWLSDVFTKLTVAKDVKQVFDRDRLDPKPAPPAKFGPIFPIDGLTQPNIVPDPEPFTLSFETADPKTGEKKTTFRVGEPVLLKVKTSKPIYMVAISTDPRGEIDFLTMEPLVRQGPIKPANNSGYQMQASGVPKTTWTLYASTAPFTTAVLHHDKRLAAYLKAEDAMKTPPGPFGAWLADRLVLPIWNDDGTTDFDPNQIIKRTIDIEVTK